MITYSVDVYHRRPIGASLLTTSPQQGCLALKGLRTGWLGVVTGIRLIHIIAAATAERHGDFLVIFYFHLCIFQNFYYFCFAAIFLGEF